ncbi:AraC family transcriptional regulator [Agrobacterium tumefaciens]|uniref:AraC family transcriptional regulator n=1 Tax=Agrobacterium tumefaciens TaxID=358 RepID=A0A0D0KJU0_AGRTU|nr:AraC family transcriptional regulator [Agrobacterium tumefaciens]
MSVSFTEFQPDLKDGPLVALRVSVDSCQTETPEHTHESGQLILALKGAVTCQVPGYIWIVPPGCAVWIPGGIRHNSRMTANASVCFVFVKRDVARLPEHPCTIEISPMVREIILHLAATEQTPSLVDHNQLQLKQVLLGQLEIMQLTTFRLPMPTSSKLKIIMDALVINPAERSTLSDWASRVAMSERTLARLINRETGMTFGRWRQQLHLLVALRFLAEGTSVQNVSESLGYGSVTAFITMFKKALGTTPSRYLEASGRGKHLVQQSLLQP